MQQTGQANWRKGYTNLMSHRTNDHNETWKDDYRRSNSKEQVTISFPKVDKKAEILFWWMEKVILECREFSFVEKPLVRKITKLEPICQKLLQKYFDIVAV